MQFRVRQSKELVVNIIMNFHIKQERNFFTCGLRRETFLYVIVNTDFEGTPQYTSLNTTVRKSFIFVPLGTNAVSLT